MKKVFNDRELTKTNTLTYDEGDKTTGEINRILQTNERVLVITDETHNYEYIIEALNNHTIYKIITEELINKKMILPLRKFIYLSRQGFLKKENFEVVIFRLPKCNKELTETFKIFYFTNLSYKKAHPIIISYFSMIYNEDYITMHTKPFRISYNKEDIVKPKIYNIYISPIEDNELFEYASYKEHLIKLIKVSSGTKLSDYSLILKKVERLEEITFRFGLHLLKKSIQYNYKKEKRKITNKNLAISDWKFKKIKKIINSNESKTIYIITKTPFLLNYLQSEVDDKNKVSLYDNKCSEVNKREATLVMYDDISHELLEQDFKRIYVFRDEFSLMNDMTKSQDYLQAKNMTVSKDQANDVTNMLCGLVISNDGSKYKKTLEILKDAKDDTDKFYIETTSATVNFDFGYLMLTNFFVLLQNMYKDEHFYLKNLNFDFSYIEKGGLFICTLKLPTVHKEFTEIKSKLRLCKNDARKCASIAAFHFLHKKGFMDDYLCPIKQKFIDKNVLFYQIMIKVYKIRVTNQKPEDLYSFDCYNKSFSNSSDFDFEISSQEHTQTNELFYCHVETNGVDNKKLKDVITEYKTKQIEILLQNSSITPTRAKSLFEKEYGVTLETSAEIINNYQENISFESKQSEALKNYGNKFYVYIFAEEPKKTDDQSIDNEVLAQSSVCASEDHKKCASDDYKKYASEDYNCASKDGKCGGEDLNARGQASNLHKTKCCAHYASKTEDRKAKNAAKDLEFLNLGIAISPSFTDTLKYQNISIFFVQKIIFNDFDFRCLIFFQVVLFFLNFKKPKEIKGDTKNYSYFVVPIKNNEVDFDCLHNFAPENFLKGNLYNNANSELLKTNFLYNPFTKAFYLYDKVSKRRITDQEEFTKEHKSFLEYFEEKYNTRLLLKEGDDLLIEGFMFNGKKSDISNVLSAEIMQLTSIPENICKSFAKLKKNLFALEKACLIHEFVQKHNLKISNQIALQCFCAKEDEYENYERLEFLGDSVLKFVTVKHIFLSENNEHEKIELLKKVNDNQSVSLKATLQQANNIINYNEMGDIVTKKDKYISNNSLFLIAKNLDITSYFSFIKYSDALFQPPNILNLIDSFADYKFKEECESLVKYFQAEKTFASKNVSYQEKKSLQDDTKIRGSKTYADIVEALIGAHFVELGFKISEEFIHGIEILSKGHAKGHEKDHEKGHTKGHTKDTDKGHDKDIEKGHDKGIEKGHEKGNDNTHKKQHPEKCYKTIVYQNDLSIENTTNFYTNEIIKDDEIKKSKETAKKCKNLLELEKIECGLILKKSILNYKDTEIIKEMKIYKNILTEQEIKEIEKILNYKFINKGLIEKAMIHPSSHGNILGSIQFNKLELLGDSALDLVVTEYIYYKYKNFDPEKLHVKRKSFVNNFSLARVLFKTNLYRYLHICFDNNHIQNVMMKLKKDGDTVNKAFGDVFESVCGGIFVDMDFCYYKFKSYAHKYLFSYLLECKDETK